MPTVASAVDVVVHLELGRDGRRRVREIVAVTGRVEDGVVETAELFALHDDRLERSGGYPSHPERFAVAGYDLAALLTAGDRG